MPKVYLALGSNIAKKRNLKKCISLIRERYKLSKLSSVYETIPVGYLNQPKFYNMAIGIRTDKPPKELFNELLEIERKLKRIRTKRNYPRTIDIDILFYNKKIIKSKNLIVPHPRLHKRSFVLMPLNEIAPDFIHPQLKKPIKKLLNELNETEIIKRVKINL